MAEESTKKKRRREENVEIIIKTDLYRQLSLGITAVKLAESHRVSALIDVFARHSSMINV